jgi:hypothetical protein
MDDRRRRDARLPRSGQAARDSSAFGGGQAGSRELQNTPARLGDSHAETGISPGGRDPPCPHQAKAARDAARQHREALIEGALADYYQAAAIAGRIRDTARRKCEELLAEAERTAEPQDAAVAQAVGRLRDLLGGVTETAQLCGLTTATVREVTYRAAHRGSPWG